MSNFAFCQTKISDFLKFYFAIIGVGSSIIASEINFFQNEDNSNKDWVIYMMTIANVSSLFLMCSIVASGYLHIEWLKTKLIVTPIDNLYNTGMYKWMIIEVLLCAVMNYPSLYGVDYTETAIPTAGTPYVLNDFMLCLMIFIRLPYLLRLILMLSDYQQPRAQRVCSIYGCDANNLFSLKCVMKESSHKVVFFALIISTITFSYNLRLFER